MNIRDLEYFVAVADTKHFAKAAERCFVSQPTLSMQLKKLEEELGIQLLERSNKKVLITQVGEQILSKAKCLLQNVRELEETAEFYKNPYSGSLKLGAFPTLAPYLFPKIIPSLAKEFKNLKIFLVEEKTNVLVSQLEEGLIDVAFLALPIESQIFEFQTLFQEPFYLATPNSHQLAKKKSVTKQDLFNREILLLEEGHCLREQALEVCSLRGANENQDFRATSLETLRQMVAGGVGITLIPEIAVKRDRQISYIPFSKPEPSRIIGVFYRKTFPRKELINNLVNRIRSFLHKN